MLDTGLPMNETEYRSLLARAYRDALGCLAMEFRGIRDDVGRREKITAVYNGVLELLLDTGWSELLEADEELPLELMSQRYVEHLRANEPPRRHVLAFLHDGVRLNDLALVTTIGFLAPQRVRVRVERVYSTQHGLAAKQAGAEIEFVGLGGGWGSDRLAAGQRALVLLATISGRLYESGHLVVEDVDGVEHAIYRARELWKREDVPVAIRENSRQDPRRLSATAIRFEVIERYLLELIRRVETAR
jgi:hypothetical protein